MNEIVKIGNENIPVVEWKGQRVITTSLLADVYGATDTQIKQNFNNNEKHFEEGKHYFLLKGEELKGFKRVVENFDLPFAEALKFTSQLYLWTRRGASRHSKMLGTDKAWEQFDELEENYYSPIRKLTALERLQLQQEAILEVNTKVQNVENRIVKLENNMTITHEQIQIIKNRVNSRIVNDVLGGYDSRAYNDIHLRGRVYSRFNKDYCDYFRINARANTLALKFDEALQYINMWQPDTNMKLMIEYANAQMYITQ